MGECERALLLFSSNDIYALDTPHISFKRIKGAMVQEESSWYWNDREQKSITNVFQNS